MVRTCSVHRCNSQFVKGRKVSFHLFPSDPVKKNLWITAVKEARKTNWNFIPGKFSYVCSKHFTEDCFNTFGVAGVLKTRTLKPNAIPSVFFSSSPDTVKRQLDFSEPSTSSCMQQQETTDNLQTEIFPSPMESQEITEVRQQSDMESVSDSSTITAESNDPIIFTSSSAASPVKEPAKKRKSRSWNPRYVGDCASSDMSSPNKARRNWGIAKEHINIQKKRIQRLNLANRRLRAKISDLKTLLLHLKETSLISSENAEINILASLPTSAEELFKRMLTGPTRQKYTPELRNFAITLNFYSRKAYDYVRGKFNNSLPHPQTISRWFRSIDGSPGFTTEAIQALKIKVAEANTVNKNILCHLMMDEMSIRRQVEWTGTKFTGLVGNQFGTSGIDSDELQEAKEILVFMLVAINGHWKIPVGYFLLNGLSGAEKANLVLLCLEFVHDSGVTVTSLTFDGAAANLNMVKHLGADITDIENMKTSFLHPVTGDEVFIIPDACHMLKLLRNCLASQQIIIDGNGRKIQWDYFKKLVHLQEEEGLHAGTKLRKRHMEWYREKMKVFLAAHTFSNSVANALEFCAHDLKLADFHGVDATVQFCRVVNNIFDIFNTTNSLSKTFFKKPLSSSNSQEIFHYLDEYKSYLKSLRNIQGGLLVESTRKTGFMGFLAAIESLKAFFVKFIDTTDPKLNFVMTYKFSQDHLELFFSAVRSRGGNNNNPTARQFEATYKRLIVHTELKGSKYANSIALDDTTILNVTQRTITVNQDGEDMSNERLDMSDTYFSPEAWNLTCFSDNVVTYMAGFVVKRIKNIIVCGICLDALESYSVDSDNFKLQIRKTYGNLQQASSFVVNVCRVAEKCVRYAKISGSIFKTNIKKQLINTTLRNLPPGILDTLHNHILDQEPLNNHGTQLINLILDIYFKIRIHHETKVNLEKTTSRIRSMYTKTILFKNQ